MNRSRNTVEWCIGVGIAAAAFAVYLLTLSRGAFPGRSAALIVQHLGLFPRIECHRPLWSALVWTIGRMPAASAAAPLNVLSAVCGAACVGLLYGVVSGAVRLAVSTDETNRALVVTAARLAGAGAALFLAFCTPFWVVSNRAHHAAFDVFLLLLSFGVLLRYAATGKARYVCLFAFLFGAGAVEFPTFWVMAPVFGVLLLLAVLRRESLSLPRVLQMLGAMLMGSSLYFVAAWRFYGSEGYEARGFTGYGHLLWLMWRDQWLLIRMSLPRVGWFIILVVMVAPWLTVLGVARRGLNDEGDWTYYPLHAVLTGLAVAVLAGLGIAPWPMLGMRHLLVTPYVLMASVFGYLLAYWFLLPAVRCQNAESAARRRAGLWIGWAAALLGLAGACVAPFFNLPEADGRKAGWFNRYAARVVDDLGQRTWLISDGTLDHQILLAAYDKGVPVRLVNLSQSENSIYMSYLARQFDDVRLRNLAGIGMTPLLKEWFRSDRSVTETAAVLSLPDIWSDAGHVAVPNRTLFTGAMPGSVDVDDARLLADHEAFWREFHPGMGEAETDPEFLEPYRAYVRRHLGLVANNLGVFFEDRQADAEAFRAYAWARRIDPENVSALLNQFAMLEGGFEDSAAERIRASFEELAAELEAGSRFRIGPLSRMYGHVRMPEAFAQRGWSWVDAGRPDLAVSDLRRAIELTGEDRRGRLQEALAFAYLLQSEDALSESVYAEILEEEPQNPEALDGMFRIVLFRGETDRAAAWLARAREAGLAPPRIAIMQASLAASEGQFDAARKTLEELVRQHADLLEAWAVLLGVLLQQGEDEAVRRHVRRIETVAGGRVLGSLISGELAARKDDLAEARKHVQSALGMQPNNPAILESMLRIDVLEGNAESAHRHAMRLLRVDPHNALGSYVMGSLQAHRGDSELAEDSYRRSLRAQPSRQAWNGLAWLLQTQGRYEEAERAVRAALELDPEWGAAWDTLGVVLMRSGRLREARQALERCRELVQDDPRVFVHAAELEALDGNPAAAREHLARVAEQWPARAEALSADVDRVRKLLGEH